MRYSMILPTDRRVGECIDPASGFSWHVMARQSFQIFSTGKCMTIPIIAIYEDVMPWAVTDHWSFKYSAIVQLTRGSSGPKISLKATRNTDILADTVLLPESSSILMWMTTWQPQVLYTTYSHVVRLDPSWWRGGSDVQHCSTTDYWLTMLFWTVDIVDNVCVSYAYMINCTWYFICTDTSIIVLWTYASTGTTCHMSFTHAAYVCIPNIHVQTIWWGLILFRDSQRFCLLIRRKSKTGFSHVSTSMIVYILNM